MKHKRIEMESNNEIKQENQVKESAPALTHSQEFLQSVLNSAHYGIASYEPISDPGNTITDFRIIYSNPEVPKNFGMTTHDVIGKTCREVYPGIFDNGVFEKLVHTMETGETENYEVAVNKDGKPMWLSAAVEKVNHFVTVTSKNITKEKTTAIHLQELNKLLSNKNKELEQQILQEFSESFSSYKTGKDFFDLLVLELYHKTKMDYVLLGKILQNEESSAIQCFAVSAFGKIVGNFSYPLKDGPCAEVIDAKISSYSAGCMDQFPKSQTVMELNIEGYIGIPLHDYNGKCIGLMAVMHQSEIRDAAYIESLLKIAAKRCEMELEGQRNEKVLEEKNAELEQKNKELESFNYIASHDLQEPLRKIQLFYSRILDKDRQNLSQQSVDYFDSIHNAADRMQNLIEALLSYSTANYANMSFEKTDLNVLLEDVKADLEDRIVATDAIILSEPLPKISVVPFQFRQLLLNMISNGIKYSKKEVPPVIRITNEITSPAEFPGKKYLKIAIEDNGIGFEQQYEDKIFELFQRLHGKTEFVGTGIGLAICKRIIENHKGFIKVESEPGNGSVFTIYLPSKN